MTAMNRNNLLRGVVVLLVIVPAAYFVYAWNTTGFVESTMGNWFATVIGLIAGIPIALELTRWQQRAQDEQGRKARELEEKAHKTKILELLKGELEYNAELIRIRKPDAQTERQVKTLALRNVLWRAFSDGGELQWINDPDLINKLANAYYYVDFFIFYETKHIEASNFPGFSYSINEILKRTRGTLDYSDASARQAVKDAIDAVDIALGNKSAQGSETSPKDIEAS